MYLLFAQIALVVAMAVAAVSVVAGQTWEGHEARLDALRDRVVVIEQLKVADRLARVEEGQASIRQLQYAQLAGILSLALEVIARRLRKQ